MPSWIADKRVAVVFRVPAHILNSVVQKISQQAARFDLTQLVVLSQNMSIHMPNADAGGNDHFDALR